MSTIQLTIPLRRRRDLLLARHRTRQIAGLLGFSAVEQARLAAAAFDLACIAYDDEDDPVLRFETTAGALCIDVAGSPGWKAIQEPLPAEARLTFEDAGWALEQLIHLVPFRVFEEVERQNQDVRLLTVESTQTQRRRQAA